MIHYTMVKTTTFNGIKLPSIVIKKIKTTNYKIIKTLVIMITNQDYLDKKIIIGESIWER